jgi:hypothetical protein
MVAGHDNHGHSLAELLQMLGHELIVRLVKILIRFAQRT